MATFIAS